jgi:mannitol/fructose-specific phosphotransferase system IIA component (Ntr-type)
LFPGDKPVKVLIAISSDGDDGHLDMLSEIGSVLMEDELVEKLKNATTVQQVSSIFSNNKF